MRQVAGAGTQMRSEEVTLSKTDLPFQRTLLTLAVAISFDLPVHTSCTHRPSSNWNDWTLAPIHHGPIWASAGERRQRKSSSEPVLERLEKRQMGPNRRTCNRLKLLFEL